MEKLKTNFQNEILPDLGKIRVGLRGISGQLGARVCAVINSQPDMVMSLGISRKDRSFRERGRALEASNPETEFIFTDEDDGRIEDKIRQSVDVFIDATSDGIASQYENFYAKSEFPVIVQSGDRNFQAVAAAPVFPEKSKIIRQGDCNVSGLAPVLSALCDVTDSLQLTVIMQYGTQLRDKPRDTRLHSIDFRRSNNLHEDLSRLFPDVDLVINQIVQVPGLRFYAHIIDLHTKIPFDKEELHFLLNRHPRIKCIAESNSTFQIQEQGEMFRQRGRNLPPITPLTLLTKEYDPKHLTFYTAVDSRNVTVFSNVDAARFLGSEVEPLEAMKQTDRALNFI